MSQYWRKRLFPFPFYHNFNSVHTEFNYLQNLQTVLYSKLLYSQKIQMLLQIFKIYFSKCTKLN